MKKIKVLLFLIFIVSFSGCSNKKIEVLPEESVVTDKSSFGALKDSMELTLPNTDNATISVTKDEQFASQYYIFPNSDKVLITQADLFIRDAFTWKLAKNEIFARKGYVFKNKALHDYFNNMPWYKSDESVKGTFDELNEIEKQNVTFIEQYSDNTLNAKYYENFKNKEINAKDKMSIQDNAYHLSYEEIFRNGSPCYKESFQMDFNYDGFLEELTVYFYPDYGSYSCEIEIIDSKGQKYTQTYDTIFVDRFVNVADFDVQDGLIQFYISEHGPSYDPNVQIFSFDGEKIIRNTDMIGFVTKYDGRSKIYSFDEYSVNCYYDLNKGLTPFPKENIVNSTIEAVCNIELFDMPFTETTAVITSQFLLDTDYTYTGKYSENYIGVVPKGTQLEILDIEFEKHEDGSYSSYSPIPWLKIKTPTGTVGWFHLYYGD